MSILIETLISPAVLDMFFPGIQVQKLQNLLQLNICHHAMLVRLKIHLSLQKETNTYGQRNKHKYAAPTTKEVT